MQQKVKNTIKRLAPWVVLLLLLAGLAAAHGLTKAFTNHYEIMDGDWQNYNPVRRLLAGQRPFEDFTVYLGAGELYSVAAVLLVIGNSFGRSMLATNLLTWFFFELLVLAAAVAVFRRGRAVRGFTLAFSALAFAVVHGVLAFPGSALFSGALELAASNGNSARMIRSGSLALAVLALALGFRLWRRGPRPAGARGLRRVFPLAPGLFVPLAAGAFVPWSNDMGAALYLALSLAYGLLLIRRYGRDIAAIALRVLRYIGVSLVGLGGAVLLVSAGHPVAWLRQTRGAGAYQAWYYGAAADEKLTDLSQIPVNAALFLVLALAVFFAVRLFLAKSEGGVLSAAGCFVLCLAMALWHLAYCVLSCSLNGPIQGVSLLLAILLPALAVRAAGALLPALPKLRRAAAPACALFAAAVCGVGLAGQVSARAAGRGADYSYLPSLGAWLGDQAQKLETEQSVAAGRTVWGTYAGALEAMTDQFQPAGTDYIIHVLGDRQRADYLARFAAGGFDLVETPSYKVSEWERWSRNANWWFYRELYRGWEPVGTTYACGGMHIFWQRTGADNDLGQQTAVELTRESGDRVTITVTTADPQFCGVADVSLNYAFQAPRRLGGTGDFLWAEAVTEEQLCAAAGRPTWGCNFYLPTDRESGEIPVTIDHGVGVVTLSSVPAGAQLQVNSASVNATYPDWEYFYE